VTPKVAKWKLIDERGTSILGVSGGCEAKEEKQRTAAPLDVGEPVVQKLHDMAAMVVVEELYTWHRPCPSMTMGRCR